jgi:tRNA(Ile)-lysidine synthase
LAWEGSKPATGLPAAARAARHRLLAEAARRAGAKVLLLGHTASDAAEGEVMRAEGANIGRLREWSPSPVWPEGRELFCLRPLLGVSRDEVRERLSSAGWGWIDDPANEDLRYGRARARKSLPSPHHARKGGDDGLLGVTGGVAFEAAGFARFPVRPSDDPAYSRLLQILLLCVSGGETPVRGSKVHDLAHGSWGRDRTADLWKPTTLGGCRVVPDGDDILVVRELGRRAPEPLDLLPDRPVVWDGRFEVTADDPGLSVRPLKGLSARLSAAERAALAAIPAAARPSLPAVVREGDQTVTCPFLAEAPGVHVRALAQARFRAACGLTAHETAI